MGYTYVIEHMEEDEATPSSLPPWVELEYSHMIMLAGPAAQVQFTQLSQKSCDSLQNKLALLGGGATASFGVYTQSILDLLGDQSVPISKVCLLDPKADRKLEPEDGREFDWFLFGARYSRPGDDPPRDRTSQLRHLGFPTRHLGPVQMTTDTALGVTKRVIDDKTPLDDIPYVEFPTIQFNARESVEMPFKELLHEDLNKSFDF
ncbi:SAM-dependent RNA methyltransferase [Melanogaster broomeanus]|nr:SAM-dependent RNA methyltransferase [Melanogaster broomeanus]